MVVIYGALQALPESGCPGKAQLHSTCCKLRTQLDQLIKLIKCHADLTVSGPGLAVGLQLIKYAVGEGLRTNTCHVVHGQARRSDVAIGNDASTHRRPQPQAKYGLQARPGQFEADIETETKTETETETDIESYTESKSKFRRDWQASVGSTSKCGHFGAALLSCRHQKCLPRQSNMYAGYN